MAYRKLRPDEIALIRALLAFAGREDLAAGLGNAEVQAIPGGETGSLVFAPASASPRKFGDVLATAEAEDSDGVLITFALNLDGSGALYELDVWKDDLSRVISLPDVSRLRK